jgi:mannose-1-phosphate guanylyltransferase
MRALLLAAGFGTRLRPITDTIPKVMADIAGEPLLGHWLRLLRQGGIEKTLVNTHYLPDVIRRYVVASEFAPFVDFVHENALLGTGGTLLANRRWFGEGPLLVTHGDNASELDVTEFIAAHLARPGGVTATMALFRTDTPSTCGIAELDSRNIVRAFYEKVANPPGNLANAAAFVFEPEIFARLEALRKPVIDLSAELIPKMLGQIQGFEITGYHRDIGTPESLRLASQYFAGKSARKAARA